MAELLGVRRSERLGAICETKGLAAGAAVFLCGTPADDRVAAAEADGRVAAAARAVVEALDDDGGRGTKIRS